MESGEGKEDSLEETNSELDLKRQVRFGRKKIKETFQGREPARAKVKVEFLI